MKQIEIKTGTGHKICFYVIDEKIWIETENHGFGSRRVTYIHTEDGSYLIDHSQIKPIDVLLSIEEVRDIEGEFEK